MLIYQNTAPLALWDVSAYAGLWLAYRIVLLLFWITAAYSATQVFRSRCYDPGYLLHSGQ